MRLLPVIIMILLTTSTYATTINITISKGSNLSAYSREAFLDKKTFPQKTYAVQTGYLNNTASEKTDESDIIKIENAQSIAPTMQLNLITYNKLLNVYQFNLILKQEAYLYKTRNIGKNLGKNMAAKVYFTDTKSPSIQLNNKFIIYDGILSPSVPSNEKDSFRLSVNKLNQITVYATRDIPITIEIND